MRPKDYVAPTEPPPAVPGCVGENNGLCAGEVDSKPRTDGSDHEILRLVSREDVEVVLRVNAAFAARDIEAFLALHHSDAEVIVLRSAIEGPYRDHEGVRRMATEAFNTADLQLRVDEVRDCGNNLVLVLGQQQRSSRGRPV